MKYRHFLIFSTFYLKKIIFLKNNFTLKALKTKEKIVWFSEKMNSSSLPSFKIFDLDFFSINSCFWGLKTSKFCDFENFILKYIINFAENFTFKHL